MTRAQSAEMTAAEFRALTGADMPRTIPEQCAHVGLPAPVAEHRFHPKRRWRFDFAWPREKVALEIEGGVFTHGRHTRGKGFMGDLQKYNAAEELGWQLFRVTPGQVRNGEAIAQLQRSARFEAALNGRMIEDISPSAQERTIRGER